MKKIITVVVILFSDIFLANAQIYVGLSESSFFDRVSVGINGGIGQYRGDYHSFTYALEDLDYNAAFGISVAYNINYIYDKDKFNDFFDRRLSFVLGFNKFSFSSDKDGYDGVMSINAMEVSLVTQFNILKYCTTKRLNYGANIFTPYIEAGIALAGVQCDNSNDLTLAPDGNYKDSGMTMYPVALLGWGFKLNIFRGITLSLDGSYRFAFSDEMDHLSGNTARNDQYYYVGVGLMFNLGELFIDR